jgi:hypothetical protein
VLESAVVVLSPPDSSGYEPVGLRLGERLALLHGLFYTKITQLWFFLEYAVGCAIGQGQADNYH